MATRTAEERAEVSRSSRARKIRRRRTVRSLQAMFCTFVFPQELVRALLNYVTATFNDTFGEL